MNNVMVDLETLSLSNTPVVLSIGAVKFDVNGIDEEVFYERISRESCIGLGLVEDSSTIAWWEQQDPDVYAEALSGTRGLKEVLEELTEWLGEDAKVWGNGACADNVWLKSAYAACGLEVPWKFWNDRCYRTVLALFPKTVKVRPRVAHNALEDAEAQALTLRSILNWDEGEMQL